jgi:hypothetical protein
MITKSGGHWIVKKKFLFAACAFAAGSIIAFKGAAIATSPDEISVLLGSYSTFCGWLIGLVFTADVADKKLNGGAYNATDN